MAFKWKGHITKRIMHSAMLLLMFVSSCDAQHRLCNDEKCEFRNLDVMRTISFGFDLYDCRLCAAQWVCSHNLAAEHVYFSTSVISLYFLCCCLYGKCLWWPFQIHFAKNFSSIHEVRKFVQQNHCLNYNNLHILQGVCLLLEIIYGCSQLSGTIVMFIEVEKWKFFARKVSHFIQILNYGGVHSSKILEPFYFYFFFYEMNKFFASIDSIAAIIMPSLLHVTPWMNI